jgi:CheY-like chemotaxis protein
MEVARRHRAAESPGTRTLIIATTALSTAADRATCIEAGMDAFISKPITPGKLRAVLSELSGNAPAGEAPAGPVLTTQAGIDLGMIVHLTDGTAASLEREIEKYVYSLNEAVREVRAAHAADTRPAISSAAHRVLSLARMVGAQSLAESAADLQDFAAAFTESELAGEVDTLATRSAQLREELESLSEGSSLSSSPAS